MPLPKDKAAVQKAFDSERKGGNNTAMTLWMHANAVCLFANRMKPLPGGGVQADVPFTKEEMVAAGEEAKKGGNEFGMRDFCLRKLGEVVGVTDMELMVLYFEQGWVRTGPIASQWVATKPVDGLDIIEAFEWYRPPHAPMPRPLAGTSSRLTVSMVSWWSIVGRSTALAGTTRTDPPGARAAAASSATRTGSASLRLGRRSTMNTSGSARRR